MYVCDYPQVDGEIGPMISWDAVRCTQAGLNNLSYKKKRGYLDACDWVFIVNTVGICQKALAPNSFFFFPGVFFFLLF